jgi:iron complex transport system permease protein
MREKVSYWLIWVFVLSGFLLGIGLFSLWVGPKRIPFSTLISLIFERRISTESSILFDIRLPRIILGFAIGGSLSLAGVILQGMFRNPLVEPYTLGISGGAGLGVSLNIVLRLHQKVGVLSLPLSGFLGALSVVFFLYFLSTKRGVLKIHNLLLYGVMISFISSSLIMLIMAISRVEDLHGIIFWMMGSLEEPNGFLISLTLLLSILGLILSYLFSISLNALSVGEEEALHLGIDVEKTKRFLFLLATLLTGMSVSVAGMIGFVGLVVPHFVRFFIGRDHRILLLGSFLCGSSFLILCDTLARTVIAPSELPVGVITGILGGSLFIYALGKRNMVL